MITVPLLGILALVVAMAVILKAVKLWIVAAIILFGLYAASTTAGQQIVHGVDNLTHHTTAPTTPGGTR